MNRQFASQPIEVQLDAFATRATAQDYTGMAGYLPNPDEVLRKIGRDQEVFKELTKDATLMALTSSRKSGVLSNLWQVVGEDQARAKIISDNLKAMDIYNVMSQAADFPFYGFIPMEVIWGDYVGGLRLGKAIEQKPNRWFSFSDTNELLFHGMTAVAGVPVPKWKFIVAANSPTYDNPYGEAMLSRCYWPVTMKTFNVKKFISFIEKYGSPFALGKVLPSTGDAKVSAMLSMLRKLIQGGAGVVDNDSSVEIVDAAKTSSANVYNDFIRYCNEEMSKAILGHTAAASSTPGKLGNESGMIGVRDDLAMMDRRIVEQVINTYIQWVVDINWGDKKYPKFELYTEQEVDLNLAQRDAALSGIGVKFTPDYFKDAYGLKDGQFTVGEPPSRGLTFSAAPATAPASKATPIDQAAVDAEVSALAEEGDMQSQMEPIIAPVKKLFAKSNSFTDAMAGLVQIYPEMNTDRLEEELQKAIFVANAIGRQSVAGERKG